MKKFPFILITIFVLNLFSINTFAENITLFYDGKQHNYSQDIYNVKVNGENIQTDVPPILIQNRYLVPVRAIFQNLDATVEWKASSQTVIIKRDQTEIHLKISSNSAYINNNEVIMDVPAKIVNNRTVVPLRFVGEQLGMLVNWLPDKKLLTIDEKNITNRNIQSITFLSSDKNCSVVVELDKPTEYSSMVLSNPDRIVIDLTNTIANSKTPSKIEVNTESVKAIRYAQLDAETFEGINSKVLTSRVVIDLFHPTSFDLINKDNKIQIIVTEKKSPLSEKEVKMSISRGSDSRGKRELNVTDNLINNKPTNKLDSESSIVSADSLQTPNQSKNSDYDSTYKKVYKSLKNAEYLNTGDRVSLILTNTKLTSGGNNLSKLYKSNYDIGKKEYTITVSNSLADLDSGIISINDKWLEKIEIKKDSAETKIIFTGKDNHIYNTFTRETVNNTAITILKPPSSKEPLVVIDPGHGGSEPGALNDGIFEKDLNLDIALKLNALLKAKNISTYMIRENDSYVDLYERAYIANSLNADLFLSIHNNASFSNANGTETLYYTPEKTTNNFSGEIFAKIIQNNLISNLKTNDRKIINRPNLVVLKATTMPAALTEIAFMTNSEDLENLKNEAFRQKAAQALSKSIQEALKHIKAEK